MEKDYGLLSKFVKEDESREKKQNPDSDFRSKIEALKNMVKEYRLPDSLKLDLESEDDDSLKLKKGLREKDRKRKSLEKMFNRER